MMRDRTGKDVTNDVKPPLENGLSQKEDQEEVQQLAAKVVDHVVKLASAKASSPAKSRGGQLTRLPTIQIDTVPSPPWSPVELSPPAEEPPLDTEQIEFQLHEEQISGPEELRESLKSYIEDVLSKAIMVAEKKIKFVGLDDDDDEEEEEEHVEQPDEKPETDEKPESEEAEIRATAEKVVEEVVIKAQDLVKELMDKLPGIPSFQIDTVTSRPPSPEEELEMEEVVPIQKKSLKKWTFRVAEELSSEPSTDEHKKPILFDEAPAAVREVASRFIKEIVGKAVALAEEKALPTVPFNFEDVDLIKRNGPWYIRVREGFMRVLRSACFCTPQRNDS